MKKSDHEQAYILGETPDYIAEQQEHNRARWAKIEYDELKAEVARLREGEAFRRELDGVDLEKAAWLLNRDEYQNFLAEIEGLKGALREIAEIAVVGNHMAAYERNGILAAIQRVLPQEVKQ